MKKKAGPRRTRKPSSRVPRPPAPSRKNDGPYKARWIPPHIPYIDGVGSLDSMANAEAWAERLNQAWRMGRQDVEKAARAVLEQAEIAGLEGWALDDLRKTVDQ